MLVKTAELDLRVPDTTKSAEALQNLSTELGGYVAEMDAQRRGELFSYTLSLRIPVERLDDALARIKRLADRIDREAVRSEDVTSQHIDLSARLKTLEATETELRRLLAESRSRQSKVEEIMAIYGKLTEIRSEIEQLQGQLQALEGLSALSTINVRLFPTESAVPVVSDGWHPAETARRSFRTLLVAVRGLADLAIMVVIVLLPIGVVIGLPVWALVRLWRTLARRRRPGAPPKLGS
ncbi:MAG TPA: DUF4349 domain-containing protein [Candidatus Polarisedimenticolia bacterium]|nr:DUF4349 domain-containing protein [Candidatus Polarisedimenticolia bacterium]